MKLWVRSRIILRILVYCDEIKSSSNSDVVVLPAAGRPNTQIASGCSSPGERLKWSLILEISACCKLSNIKSSHTAKPNYSIKPIGNYYRSIYYMLFYQKKILAKYTFTHFLSFINQSKLALPQS